MRLRNVFALAGSPVCSRFRLQPRRSPGTQLSSRRAVASTGRSRCERFRRRGRQPALAFDALKYADGSVSGHFEYTQQAGGDTVRFGVDVTCMNVYGGTGPRSAGSSLRARSDDRGWTYGWFQTLNSVRAPMRPLIVEPGRFRRRGRERGVLQQPEFAAFRPWDVQGNVQVRTS